jgi:hypothetical protein
MKHYIAGHNDLLGERIGIGRAVDDDRRALLSLADCGSMTSAVLVSSGGFAAA